MAYEQRDMSGTLFPERQKKSERGPDWTGTVMVRGETLRIAAWTKRGKRGEFLSLSFSVPKSEGYEDSRQSSGEARPGEGGPSDDDSIDF
jgi:hypothetical protein